MKMNFSAIVTVSIVIFLPGCASNNTTELKSLTGALPEDQAQVVKKMIGFDVVRKAQLGPWECYVPDKYPDGMLFCRKGKRNLFYILDGKFFQISIPQSSKSKGSFLMLTDSDNDGNFDRLEYDGLSVNGAAVRVVGDDNLDGDIDRRLDLRSDEFQVKINGKWTDVIPAGRDSNGKVISKVKVSGVWKRLKLNGYKYPYKVVPLDDESVSKK